MTASDWANFAYGWTFTAGGIGGVLWWVLRKGIQHVAAEEVAKVKIEIDQDIENVKEEIISELQKILAPMQGNVDTNTTRLERVERRMDDIYKLLIENY